MAKRKKISDKAKLAMARAQQARLERELARVAAKVEQCVACDASKAEAELQRLQARQDKERKALARRLNLPVATSKKSTSKKTGKKSTSKKATSKKASKKSTSKKTGKKKSSKKSTSKKLKRLSPETLAWLKKASKKK